jgi:cyclopropane-fatty-acyl-phospholipid synthase
MTPQSLLGQTQLLPSQTPAATRTLTPLERRARRLLTAMLEACDAAVSLRDAAGTESLGPGAPVHCIDVLDPAAYVRIALGGSIAVGETYMDGQWQTDDLVGILRHVLRNRSVTDDIDRGYTWLKRLINAVLHTARANSLRGSRRNIRAHYDLSNEFFALFLDPTMLYSSALFEPGVTDLEAASIAKMRRICQKLELKPSDHLLEIGTGWGGLAMFAAQTTGCRVTTTTISKAQFDGARQRIAAAGLSERIDVVMLDYRELDGSYDKLVSVEMVEAVGHDYLDLFFHSCDRLLRPGGLFLLQAITIEDHRYRAALRLVDFIKAYIFPGSFVPSVSVLTGASANATQLKLVNLEDMGLDYAQTLQAWRERALSSRDSILDLGFDERFVRMWEYYLAYCEAGFREQTLSDIQMLFAKSGYRGQAWRATDAA